MKLQDSLDYALKATWHAISRMYMRMGQQNNLTQTTGYILLHILDAGLPATKIAPLLGMEPTSLSRQLKSMETQQLIYRQRDRVDRRIVRIHLTEKGKAQRQQAQEIVERFNDRVTKEIPAQNLVIFRETLAQIRSISNDLDMT